MTDSLTYRSVWNAFSTTIGFLLGSSVGLLIADNPLRPGLLAVVVFVVVFLLTYPLLFDGAQPDLYRRIVHVLLVGFSVQPVMSWTVGFSLSVRTLLLGLVGAGLITVLNERYETDRWIVPSTTTETRARSVLVVGAGEAGEMLLRELRHQSGVNRRVIGFLDDDPDKQGATVNGGVSVLGTTDELVEVCRSYDVDEVIIAMPSVDGEVIRSVIGQRSSIQADMRIVPGIREIIEGDFHWNQIRPVKPEDLLGRETVEVDRDRLSDFLRGRRVLVTGAAGSIGSYLVEHLLDYPVQQVIGLDLNESDLYELEASELNPANRSRFKSMLADVRDKGDCYAVFGEHEPDLVLHAAALKHVPMVERQPGEGLKTNVSGCVNVFEAARDHDVEHCLLISTDKAVDPKNVMGYTKRLGERLIGTYQQETSSTRFAAVRFGNVLGSRGSVVPLFKRQIEEGGPVTVTHPDMVRYFMTPTEAVKLVLAASAFDDHGSTYVLDIGDPISIMDLARQLIALMGYEPDTEIPIEIVGLREGEALEETLFAEDEAPESTDHPKIRRVDSGPFSPGVQGEFESFLESPPDDSEDLVEGLRSFLEKE